jgi:hypothetical protein
MPFDLDALIARTKPRPKRKPPARRRRASAAVDPAAAATFLRRVTALTTVGGDWYEQRLRLDGKAIVLVQHEQGGRDLWMPLKGTTAEEVRHFSLQLAAAAIDLTDGLCATAGQVSAALARGARDGAEAAKSAATQATKGA